MFGSLPAFGLDHVLTLTEFQWVYLQLDPDHIFKVQFKWTTRCMFKSTTGYELEQTK